MENEKNQFANRAVEGLQTDFVVVGKHRVHSWYAWAIVGVVMGLFLGIVYVANSSGRFLMGEAALRNTGTTAPRFSALPDFVSTLVAAHENKFGKVTSAGIQGVTVREDAEPAFILGEIQNFEMVGGGAWLTFSNTLGQTMQGRNPVELILAGDTRASRRTYLLIGPNALWAMPLLDRMRPAVTAELTDPNTATTESKNLCLCVKVVTAEFSFVVDGQIYYVIGIDKDSNATDGFVTGTDAGTITKTFTAPKKDKCESDADCATVCSNFKPVMTVDDLIAAMTSDAAKKKAEAAKGSITAGGQTTKDGTGNATCNITVPAVQ